MKPNSSKYGTEWGKMGMWGQRFSAHVNPPKVGKKKQKVHPGDPAPRAGWSLHGLNHNHPSTACWHMQHTDPLWSPLPSSPPSFRILCTRNTDCIASSRLTSMPPEMLSVNLECYLPPPDLNLPGACLPLCYIDPGLHPELLNWSLELRPGKVLQAILNAVGFHLSLRVMDLSNTKEEEHPQCLSPDPIQGNMDGFPDILASYRRDTDDCTSLQAEDGDEAKTFTVLQGTDTHFHACAQWPSRIQLFATPRTTAGQAPLSTVLPQQEYRNRLPFPSPGHTP